MKNLNFMNADSIVLSQGTTTEQKTRVVKPEPELIIEALKHKQTTDFPFMNLDNLFIVGNVEMTIATDVKGIVLRYQKIDGKNVPNWKRCYRVIPDIKTVNNKEVVFHKLRRMQPTEKQRTAIESAQLAPVTAEMFA
jgi:adenylosuccinate synthase